MTKRMFYDFICAFLVFSIILLSFALLSGEGFFDDAAVWDGQKNTLSVFGTAVMFDEKIPDVVHILLSFNDVVFGKGFSDSVYKCFEFVCGYAREGICGAYNVAKAVVGAA